MVQIKEVESHLGRAAHRPCSATPSLLTPPGQPAFLAAPWPQASPPYPLTSLTSKTASVSAPLPGGLPHPQPRASPLHWFRGQTRCGAGLFQAGIPGRGSPNHQAGGQLRGFSLKMQTPLPRAGGQKAPGTYPDVRRSHGVPLPSPCGPSPGSPGVTAWREGLRGLPRGLGSGGDRSWGHQHGPRLRHPSPDVEVWVGIE